MYKDITFTNILGKEGHNLFPPKPAREQVPDWYKNTTGYINNEKNIINGSVKSTIKKCIPVFDALTSGYIIFTQVDISVSIQDGSSYFQWPTTNAIEFHSDEQAELHPYYSGMPYPKLINPWAIKTPLGYSSLFIPPMHNSNKIFTAFPGIVDTDSFHGNVNFPFILDDPKWEGIIPAGTPIVQVIPFKRDLFKMKIGNEKNINQANSDILGLRALWKNRYKTLFWKRKEYK